MLIPILLILSTYIQGKTQSGYRYSQPIELGDGWETNNLNSTVYDTSRLYAFFNQINNNEHYIHSVLLIKNKQLIIDEYFNGYKAETQQDLRSVTKSIKSILLGIAIDKGIIDDINDHISKYLKTPIPVKNLDKRKEEIRIRHLLTMSPGWDCDDWDEKSKGQEDRVYIKKDWIQYTLDLPMINDPGEVSRYCSMGIIILAEIISQASGTSIDKFADEHLFKPLGIENLNWGHTKDHEVIPSGKRLYLTPRDMAKIGQLILNEGSWNGQQIVSAEWVKESTSSKTEISGVKYAYLWWNIPFALNGRNVNSITATGNGG